MAPPRVPSQPHVLRRVESGYHRPKPRRTLPVQPEQDVDALHSRAHSPGLMGFGPPVAHLATQFPLTSRTGLARSFRSVLSRTSLPGSPHHRFRAGLGPRGEPASPPSVGLGPVAMACYPSLVHSIVAVVVGLGPVAHVSYTAPGALFSGMYSSISARVFYLPLYFQKKS